MTADGMIYSNREMMGPNGFVSCLFEETKHFWDSEIAFIDYEENVVMKKPSKAMKEKAPKKIASPKRKPKLAKHETPPKTPKLSKKRRSNLLRGRMDRTEYDMEASAFEGLPLRED